MPAIRNDVVVGQIPPDRLRHEGRMSRNGKKKVFDGQFVGITAVVLDSPAWKAMSPHARLVYIAIKRNWDHQNNNNGHLYLAVRKGAEKTGFSKNTVAKC